MVIRLALLFALILCAASCARNPRTAIVYSDSADPLVKNGIAFDRATIILGDNQTVVVPYDAQVEFSEKPGRVTILMKKMMGIMGHPPKMITIDDARNAMGCACLASDGKLRIAKYGEFSCGEGGRAIQLTIRVPQGVRVEKDNREKESQRAQEVTSSPLEIHQEGKETWCVLEGSKQRWTPIPSEPDKETFAQQ
jgi:hypothetical protein